MLTFSMSVGGAPFTPETRMPWLSVSKSFTSAMTMLLVQEERLKPDTRLGDLFEDVPRDKRRIRVDDLMLHVSGLAGQLQNPEFDGPPEFEPIDRDTLVRRALGSEPLDRALRSTRVLVRRAAVSAYRGDVVPEGYYQLAFGLADAVDVVEAELAAGLGPAGLSQEARSVLLAVGEHSAEVERTESLNAEVILVQIRSIIVDLLGVTGMGQFEATDALPPLPPR
jgi:hypothetical protein